MNETRIPINRPVVPVRVVAFLRGTTARVIEAEIESGKIDPAWDIRGRDSRRSFIIVLSKALETKVPEPLIYQWVPAWNPTVNQLARLICCSPLHFSSLIRQGLLQTVGCPKTPKHSPKVSTESFAAFLKSRRTGAGCAQLHPPSLIAPTPPRRMQGVCTGMKTGGVQS